MKTIALGLAGLLAGCAGLQSDDPASPHYVFDPGWVVQVNRALTIPPGAATVRLQGGRIVARNSVQEYAPFCIVELETVRDQAQILQPGRFAVWRVTRHVDPISAAAPAPLRTVRYDDGGEPSFFYYITQFRVRDPQPPNLRSLRCAWDQLAPGHRPFMRHLTLAEMRGALGDWVSLLPPDADT
jgi:hypothetical protein